MISRNQLRQQHGLQLQVFGIFLSCLIVGTVRADVGPRTEGEVARQDIERVRFIGVSRFEALPALPFTTKADLEGQVTGVPVPVFAVISDEQVARGETRTASTDEALTAVVYRNSYDSGWGQFGKATEGNFVGNLLHLGNGFPVTGGDVSRYDLLVYNAASNPGGEATVYVSLWNGDPLGWIDTRISDPPEEIAGTGCTFSGLVKGGLGSNGCVDGICDGGFLNGNYCDDDADCGACPAVPGDDIPECPGLFRLECDFAEPVTLPSRNVWMIVQHLEGCRTGWRWAVLGPPEVAAVGEENFCDNTCPSSPMPCVDLAVEYVDAASQWYEQGAGTCCEDPGIVCDHSDGTHECGHPTSCSDGVAETFDAWCFGAEMYWASFVASVYSPTSTSIGLVPVASTDPAAVISGDGILTRPRSTVLFDIRLAGWDAEGAGRELKVWSADIDSSGYASGDAGELSPHTPPCTVDADCPYATIGSTCVEGPSGATDEACTGEVCSCTAGFFNCGENAPLVNACLDLPAILTSSLDYMYGSIAVFGTLADPGVPAYAASLLLDVSEDAAGTFTIFLKHDPYSFMKDQNSQTIPLVAIVPAQVTIGCGGLSPPRAEPDPVSKNRYLSFVPGAGCAPTAQRVTFESLPPPNDVLNGKAMWVGSPYQLSDNSGSMGDSPPPAFTAAYLVCGPHYTDWGECGTIHVYHKGIVPEATYTIQAIEEGCPVDDEDCYSAGLTVTTNKWGDIVGDCGPAGCTPPNGIVDFTDIMSLVDKFRNLPTAVSKPRGDIGDEIPDRRVGFIDVSWAVHMFQGGSYMFFVPNAADCP